MCKELEQIESRFKEIAGIDKDLSIFPLPENGADFQTATDKGKSDNYGEVFTPLWLVDKMILKLGPDFIKAGKKLWKAKAPLDLCAGYGQFTVRMLRCIAEYRKHQKHGFEPYKWLKKHSFSELQFESIYKILYVFGSGTNIYIGDARLLNTLHKDDNGILLHNGKGWIDITKEVKKKFGVKKAYDVEEEKSFCKWLKDKKSRPKSVQMEMTFPT